MFKKAVNKYLSWGFKKRVLTIAIMFGILYGIFDLFALGTIQVWFPKQEVYPYLDNLATDVVNLKSTDFLRHLDDLEYLKELDDLDVSETYEKSNILYYYTVTEDSRENTITVELCGYHAEKLTLVVSKNYKLISLDKRCDHTAWLFFCALNMIGLYYIIGAFIGFIFNIILIAFQKIVKCYSRIRKYFSDHHRNKKAKSGAKTDSALDVDCELVVDGNSQCQGNNQGNSSEESEEDDSFSSMDYDTYEV